MNTHFTLGQLVRFKSYKRHRNEKEAYYVVIQLQDDQNEMVLFTVNTNRLFKAGETIIPEAPDEDLEVITIKPSDLILEEIIIKDNFDGSVGRGRATAFIGDDAPMFFEAKEDYLLSKNEFEFFSHSKNPINGHLFVLVDYKNADYEKLNIVS